MGKVDLVTLSDSEIISLLNNPNNQGKIICPIKASQVTGVEVVAFDPKIGGKGVYVYCKDKATVYKPWSPGIMGTFFRKDDKGRNIGYYDLKLPDEIGGKVIMKVINFDLEEDKEGRLGPPTPVREDMR